MELSGSNIKQFLIFSYISGNGNPEKLLYISGNGTFLYFKKNFQSANFFIFCHKVNTFTYVNSPALSGCYPHFWQLTRK